MVLSPKHSRGQGLLEATLSIGVILIGLGGILALTLRNVTATTASAQRIVALQLAREGIEVVRGVRDSNWLAASSGGSKLWDDGLAPPDGSLCKAAVLSSPCGAALQLTPPPDNQTPMQWQLQYQTLIGGRTSFNIPELQLFRGGSAQGYLWRQDTGWLAPSPNGNAPAGYDTTGFYRAVMLDPICQLASGTPTVATDQTACPSGQTKIGYRVESEVAWPTPGLFGGALRSTLSLVEYIYNWR